VRLKRSRAALDHEAAQLCGSRCVVHEAGAIREGDGLDTVAEAELGEDVIDVCLDGRLARNSAPAISALERPPARSRSTSNSRAVSSSSSGGALRDVRGQHSGVAEAGWRAAAVRAGESVRTRENALRAARRDRVGLSIMGIHGGQRPVCVKFTQETPKRLARLGTAPADGSRDGDARRTAASAPTVFWF